MNLNLEVAERDVYTLLDWIRSIGGFQRGLRTIFSIFLLFFTYKHYETYMVSKLYEEKDAKKLSQKQISSTKMLFFDFLTDSCKEFFNNSRCKLCRRSNSYRYFDKGIKKY